MKTIFKVLLAIGLVIGILFGAIAVSVPINQKRAATERENAQLRSEIELGLQPTSVDAQSSDPQPVDVQQPQNSTYEESSLNDQTVADSTSQSQATVNDTITKAGSSQSTAADMQLPAQEMPVQEEDSGIIVDAPTDTTPPEWTTHEPGSPWELGDFGFPRAVKVWSNKTAHDQGEKALFVPVGVYVELDNSCGGGIEHLPTQAEALAARDSYGLPTVSFKEMVFYSLEVEDYRRQTNLVNKNWLIGGGDGHDYDRIVIIGDNYTVLPAGIELTVQPVQGTVRYFASQQAAESWLANLGVDDYTYEVLYQEIGLNLVDHRNDPNWTPAQDQFMAGETSEKVDSGNSGSNPTPEQPQVQVPAPEEHTPDGNVWSTGSSQFWAVANVWNNQSSDQNEYKCLIAPGGITFPAGSGGTTWYFAYQEEAQAAYDGNGLPAYPGNFVSSQEALSGEEVVMIDEDLEEIPEDKGDQESETPDTPEEPIEETSEVLLEEIEEVVADSVDVAEVESETEEESPLGDVDLAAVLPLALGLTVVGVKNAKKSKEKDS